MLLDELNAKITPENIRTVERYRRALNLGVRYEPSLTSALLADQLEMYREYAGKPLSNSFYLHELAEIEQFRRMGVNPFGKDISDIFDANPEVHHGGFKMENIYLQLVLASRGVASSIGTIILLNPQYAPQVKREQLAQFNKMSGELHEMIGAESAPTKAAFCKIISEEPDLLEDTQLYGNRGPNNK